MASPMLPIEANPDTHIYCHVCKSIQPLVVDDPQRGTAEQFDYATDLVCGGCQFVVATAYAPRALHRSFCEAA